jgi:hypothetical protein
MFVCVHAHLCMCVCMHICMCVYVRADLYVCVCVCVCVCYQYGKAIKQDFLLASEYYAEAAEQVLLSLYAQWCMCVHVCACACLCYQCRALSRTVFSPCVLCAGCEAGIVLYVYVHLHVCTCMYVYAYAIMIAPSTVCMRYLIAKGRGVKSNHMQSTHTLIHTFTHTYTYTCAMAGARRRTICIRYLLR